MEEHRLKLILLQRRRLIIYTGPVSLNFNIIKYNLTVKITNIFIFLHSVIYHIISYNFFKQCLAWLLLLDKPLFM